MVVCRIFFVKLSILNPTSGRCVFFKMVEALEIDELSLEDFDKYFLNTVEQFTDGETVAAKIRKLFYELDTDKNAVVTKDEVKAAVEPVVQIFAQEAQHLIAGLFH